MNIIQRLKSVLFYIGFTPLFPNLLFKNNRNDDISNEYFNALAVLFIQNLTVLVGLLIYIFGYKVFNQIFPNMFLKLTFRGIFILGYPIIILFFAGIIIWLIYFIRLFIGIDIRIPLINKISRNKKILIFSYFMNLSFIILIVSIILISNHANKLSQHSLKPAKVYMLYDDMGSVPRWIFTLGFYQIQRTAINKWGYGHVSIEPISQEAIKEALLNAEMIYLSVHGGDGLFYFTNKERTIVYNYGPKQIQEIGKGKNLKFVYLANCFGGFLKDEWASVFYPAKIKTYDYVSLYPEHIYWLWFKLPKILKNQI